MNDVNNRIRVENYVFKKSAKNIGSRSSASSYGPSKIRISYEVFPDFSHPCYSGQFIIFLCHEGKATISICGRKYFMKPGFSCCILPDDFFSVTSAEANQNEFFCSCTVIFVPEKCVGIYISGVINMSREADKDIVSNKRGLFDSGFCENMTASVILPDIYTGNIVENLILDILNSSDYFAEKVMILCDPKNQFLFNAALFVHFNYKKSQLYLDDISARLHCSPYSLSRSFTNVFQKGFKVYTRNLRLHYAASLLVSSRFQTKDIAKMCVIDSPSYFTKEFINKYRLSPIEYRKKYALGKNYTVRRRKVHKDDEEI